MGITESNAGAFVRELLDIADLGDPDIRSCYGRMQTKDFFAYAKEAMSALAKGASTQEELQRYSRGEELANSLYELEKARKPIPYSSTDAEPRFSRDPESCVSRIVVGNPEKDGHEIKMYTRDCVNCFSGVA